MIVNKQDLGADDAGTSTWVHEEPIPDNKNYINQQNALIEAEAAHKRLIVIIGASAAAVIVVGFVAYNYVRDSIRRKRRGRR